MKKILTIFFLSILICNVSYSQIKREKKNNYAFHRKLMDRKKSWKKHWKSSKTPIETKSQAKTATANQSDVVTMDATNLVFNQTQYDKSIAGYRVKSNSIAQNSNLVDTKPQSTISTSFNHTDAVLSANKSFGHWTFGGKLQQKVTGTDSVATLVNLDGITTGSIVTLQFQYTGYKLKSNGGTLTPGFFANGKFTFNPVSNTYTTDSISFKQITVNQDNISGKVAFGYNFEVTDAVPMSISLGYENGTSYQANSSTAFYTYKSPNYFSVNEVFGAPKYQNINVLSFSLVGAILQIDRTPGADTVKGYAFAWEFLAGYSFSQNKYALQLPIYFIKGTEDKITALNGGVRFGYSWIPTSSSAPQPTNTGFTAEIFITTPFNFFSGIGE